MAHQNKRTPPSWGVLLFWIAFQARAFSDGIAVRIRCADRVAVICRHKACRGRLVGNALDGPPKILGSKVPENFYLLPLHSSLFTKNAPENFEVIGNSEELKSESYISSDSSQVSPPRCRHPFFGGAFFAFWWVIEYGENQRKIVNCVGGKQIENDAIEGEMEFKTICFRRQGDDDEPLMAHAVGVLRDVRFFLCKWYFNSHLKAPCIIARKML